MSELIPVTFGAEEHARAETERRSALNDWADGVLEELGYTDRVARANSAHGLQKIVFDGAAVEVDFAIQAALHPVRGRKRDHFAGLKEPALRRLLAHRFRELKADRKKALERGGTAGGKRGTNFDWANDLKLDDKGAVRPLLMNLELFLRFHPEWTEVLGFDEFATVVRLRKSPPWGGVEADAKWVDHFESRTVIWFENEDILANAGKVGRAVQAAARSNSFHPVREYLESLTWDGVARLDRWLITYVHADDTPYTRAVGPRWMISAVARIFRPGCKADHVLVLEGPQGKQKSEALRTLAVRDSWFSDQLSHFSTKDASLDLTGKWLIELAEMNVFLRATSNASKSYLSRLFDHFRPPYGTHTIDLLRQNVFCGSLNPTAGGYLKDPTGARRIWPVECHGMIDVTGIERDRDQLWAEAVVRYRASAPWWLETPELEALATAEQRLRFWIDPWTERIETWIGAKNETSVAEVLEGALSLVGAAQTRGAQMRVASVLTHLGFTRFRPRRGDARPHLYSRLQS